jgi:uncharacterized membrane protein
MKSFQQKLLSGKSAYHLIIFGCFLLYCIIFSTLSIKAYNGFNCDFDMGDILQAFHNTLDVRLMEATLGNGEFSACRFSRHTELITLLFLPFFALFPSVYTLLILQTIAIGSAGLVVYLLALQLNISKKTAVILSLCYWMFPLLAAINLFEFHADSFIITPHLLVWLFYRRKQYVFFWLSVALGMSVKEHAFFFNLLLGLMIIGEDRKRSSVLVLLALTQFFILTPVIQIIFGLKEYNLNLAAHVVNAPEYNPVFVLFRYLTYFLNNLFSSRSQFVLIILVILNITLLKFLSGLILLLPLMMVFIASGSVLFHRHAIMIAPVFIILVEGISRIKAERQFSQAFFGTLLPSIIFMLLFRNSAIGINIREMFNPQRRNVFHYQYTGHDAIVDSLIRFVPKKVPVASDTHLMTKMADRVWAFIHPYPSDSMNAQFYLFDFFEKRDYDSLLFNRKRAANLIKADSFELKCNLDGLIILAKTTDPKADMPFSLKRKDEVKNYPKESYSIIRAEYGRFRNGFLMRSSFSKGCTDLRGSAFISFFIDEVTKDTIRVLHLTSYTLVELEKLGDGIYEEEFYFDIPQGKSLQDRTHEIWLYHKNSYLPFFAREEYRLGRVWVGVGPGLSPY